MHVLLGVVQRVPERWEGGGDDMKHRDTYVHVDKRVKRRMLMMTDRMWPTSQYRLPFDSPLWRKGMWSSCTGPTYMSFLKYVCSKG